MALNGNIIGNNSNSLVIIPARMKSSRFPGKPLALINGLSMLERVWKIASKIEMPADIIIATDDAELKNKCARFGANVVMTSAGCNTGMDRAAEACLNLKSQHEIIVTLQGDAVLTPPWVLDAVIEKMQSDSSIKVSTPMVRLSAESLRQFLELKKSGSSTGTTVTFNNKKQALYFSKAVIPFIRDESKRKDLFRHIGLYAYRRETLKDLSALPQSHFEQIENLEQLRALENGISIQMVEVDYRGRTHASVDNPEDIKIVEDIIAREGELI